MRSINARNKLNIDIPIIVSTAVLVIFGLIMIYDASVVSAFRDYHDKLYYFKNQLVWVSLGTIALVFFSLFDYHKILKYAPYIFGAAILGLILVLIPGVGAKVNGARRWISLAGFTYQPSEFAKLAMIIYITSIMSKYDIAKTRFLDVIYVLFMPILFLVGLILLEPDFGTSLVFMAIAVSIYFIGNAPIWHFLVMIPPLIVGAVGMLILQPYRIERFKTFLDPTYDPQGASYQINQILISLSNGGIFGVGLGGSRGKFDFIPEVHSDAIFSVVAEELGFLGSAFMISLFLFLISRAINIAKSAKDQEGKILASGIATLLALQTFLNLGSLVALVPLTGIPLPFVSYGGSSLLTSMIAIGILLNIKRQT